MTEPTTSIEINSLVAIIAIGLTALCAIVAIPGQTTRGHKLTKQGWSAVFLAIFASLTQGTQEYMDKQEDERRAIATETALVRIESLLEKSLNPGKVVHSRSVEPKVRNLSADLEIRAEISQLRQTLKHAPSRFAPPGKDE